MTRALALAAVFALIDGVAVARMPAGGPTPEAEWFRSLTGTAADGDDLA